MDENMKEHEPQNKSEFTTTSGESQPQSFEFELAGGPYSNLNNNQIQKFNDIQLDTRISKESTNRFGDTSGVPSYSNEKHSEERKPHWGRRIGLTGAALLTSLGIGYGIDHEMNSDGGDDRPGVSTGLLPTSETTNSPTVEASPTVEVKPTVEKEEYPYEIGWEKDFGSITIAISKEMQTRTECVPPNSTSKVAGGLEPCSPMNEIFLNTDRFSNASDLLAEGISFGEYRAWQARNVAERNNTTFSDYQKKLANGDDLSFIVEKGLKGTSSVIPDKEIIYNPRKPKKIVYLGENKGGINLGGSVSIGMREMEGVFVFEIYDYFAGGLTSAAYTNNIHSNENFYLGTNMTQLLAILAHPETIQAQTLTLSFNSEVVPKMRELDKYFKPEKNEITAHAILRAR